MLYIRQWRQVPHVLQALWLLALVALVGALIVVASMVPTMSSTGRILFSGEHLLPSPTDTALIQSRTSLAQALGMLGAACAWPIMMYATRLRPRRFLVRTTPLPLRALLMVTAALALLPLCLLVYAILAPLLIIGTGDRLALNVVAGLLSVIEAWLLLATFIWGIIQAI